MRAFKNNPKPEKPSKPEKAKAKPAVLVKKPNGQRRAMSAEGQDEAILKAIAKLQKKVDQIAEDVHVLGVNTDASLHALHEKFEEIHPVINDAGK